MNRCHQTDALLDATFAGTDLTRAQASHAGACSECARALSQALRFDAELGRASHDLSPELMPATVGLTDPGTASDNRRHRVMTSKRTLFGSVAAAVLVVGVIFGSGGLPGAVPAGGISSQDLDAWLNPALVTTLVAHGRGANRAPEWAPVQIETCGDTAIAFFANPIHGNGGIYAWALGRPDDPTDAQMISGIASYLDDFGVARMRANLPVCEVVRDGSEVEGELATGLDELRRQMQAGDLTRWRASLREPRGEVEILDIGRLAPRSFVMFAEERTPDGYSVSLPVMTIETEEVIRSNGARDTYSSTYTVSSTYEAGRILPANRVLAGTEVPTLLYGRIDDPSIRAVDIVTPGERLRYSVAQPGFVIRIDGADGAVARRFEFRDADGNVIAAGPVDALHRVLGERLESPRVSMDLTCADWPGLTDRAQSAMVDGLIDDRLAPTILRSQHLPLTSTRDELVAAARASSDKWCQDPRFRDQFLSDVFMRGYGIDD